ncbi:MAG: hypothetical protein WKF34_11550 [Pyrinomonadaceae bacterium]
MSKLTPVRSITIIAITLVALLSGIIFATSASPRVWEAIESTRMLLTTSLVQSDAAGREMEGPPNIRS